MIQGEDQGDVKKEAAQQPMDTDEVCYTNTLIIN